MVPPRHSGAATVRAFLPHLGQELRKMYAHILTAEVPEHLTGLVRKLAP